MCPPPEVVEEGSAKKSAETPSPYPDYTKDQSSTLKKLVGILGVTSVAFLIATIVLAANNGSSSSSSDDADSSMEKPTSPTIEDTTPEMIPVEPAPKDQLTAVEEKVNAIEDKVDSILDMMASSATIGETNYNEDAPIDDGEEEESFSFLNLKLSSSFYSDLEDNTCAGANLQADNQPCVDLNVPQAGANVTKGYVGSLDMGDVVPNTKPYFQSSMCPVNVHWHLGTEHYSAGEYDENGSGPNGGTDLAEWANRGLAEDVRDGFRCNYYDENDEKFTKPYEWKYCVGMEVGETYEVHW